MKTKRINTKNIDFSKAEKIYFGLDRHCRCGCGGDYYYKNTEGWNYVVRTIQRLGIVNCDTDYENKVYVNIPLGDNMAYTIYFEQVVAEKP